VTSEELDQLMEGIAAGITGADYIGDALFDQIRDLIATIGAPAFDRLLQQKLRDRGVSEIEQ
jgi:hypothetical protein